MCYCFAISQLWTFYYTEKISETDASLLTDSLWPFIGDIKTQLSVFFSDLFTFIYTSSISVFLELRLYRTEDLRIFKIFHYFNIPTVSFTMDNRLNSNILTCLKFSQIYLYASSFLCFIFMLAIWRLMSFDAYITNSITGYSMV